ncbi:hypothetical protein [Hyphomicrobium sp. ghe19]
MPNNRLHPLAPYVRHDKGASFAEATLKAVAAISYDTQVRQMTEASA